MGKGLKWKIGVAVARPSGREYGLIEFRGNIDHDTADQALLAISAATQERNTLIVDLTRVGYKNEACLGPLQKGHERCTLRNGRLVVINRLKEGRRELVFTGGEGYPIVESLKEAAQLLEGNPAPV